MQITSIANFDNKTFEENKERITSEMMRGIYKELEKNNIVNSSTVDLATQKEVRFDLLVLSENNINELKDIMREINSSLTKLQKQANDAELYRTLKKDEENYEDCN